MDALQGFLVSLQRSGHKAASFQVCCAVSGGSPSLC